MSRSITVRDVPDPTADELASRAARTGRSLQEYLRDQLISLAATPDPDAWLVRIHERKATTPTTVSTTDILEDRDADRR
jgi:plasmid stability protein